MKKFPFLGIALLLAACGANDTTDTSADENNAVNDTSIANGSGAAVDNAAMPSLPTDAAGYLAMAGSADMWEIESSRAFMAKSEKGDLKRFAQMMIDNHTQSTAKLKAAAQSANVTAPTPKLDAEQQQMLDEIKNADAANVDLVYKRHQGTAHKKALALHQGYAANGDNEPLKKAAGEIAPVVQKHITELEKMSTSG